MSVSRRAFFKLVAAGAAVSFLPIAPIAEALSAPLKRPISQGLWHVMEVSYTAHPGCEALICDMELMRKHVTVRFSMRVDKWHGIRPGDMIEMELDYQKGIQVSLDGVDTDAMQSVTVEHAPWAERFEDEGQVFYAADSAFDRMDMTLSPITWGKA